MDVDEVVEELYRLPPAQFTATRATRAAEARQAGDAPAARRIAGLRKPTLAAWVSNLLARRTEEAGQLLQLAQALREAHRTLDPDQFRTLSHQRHVVVAGLAREAGRLARQAGQPVSGSVLHEVEQILHAALADPEIAEQWSTGTLTKAPAAPTDFPGTAPVAQVKQKPGGPAAPARGGKERDTAADRRRARLKDAMKAATEAAAEVNRRDEAVRRAEKEHERATARRSAADERVEQLTARLGEAQEEQRAAAEEADAAARRVREATRERRAAQRTADTASRAVRRLSDGDPEL
ncbi:hypothetical protein ACFVTY_10560 [Streptomyces sp. NPDC058067]|uniref:hypothetical protein n=1 Tax=Streptomyces sp. NPDC058067 TaxID=3346324 RepID=UPI0036E12103